MKKYDFKEVSGDCHPWDSYVNGAPEKDVRRVSDSTSVIALSSKTMECLRNHPDITPRCESLKIPEGLLFIITPEQRFRYESVLLANVFGVSDVVLDNTLGFCQIKVI